MTNENTATQRTPNDNAVFLKGNPRGNLQHVYYATDDKAKIYIRIMKLCIQNRYIRPKSCR